MESKVEEQIKTKVLEALNLITDWYKSGQKKTLEFNAKLGVINAELKRLKEQKTFEEMAIEAEKAASLFNDFIKAIKKNGLSFVDTAKYLQGRKVSSREEAKIGSSGYSGCGATFHEMGKGLERQVEEILKKELAPKGLSSEEFQKELRSLVDRFGGENLTMEPEFIYRCDRTTLETKYHIKFSTLTTKP